MTEQPEVTHQDSRTTDTIANTLEKAIVWKYMVQGWGQGDLEVVDEIVATNVIDHDPFPGQKAGREGWKQALLMIRAVMPDMKVAIEEMVQEGEHVAVRYVCLGTNTGEFQGRPPTGKPMLIRGIGIERVTNGKMSETHRILDIRFDYQPSTADVASSGQATLVRVPLNWDGSPGTPAVYLKNVSIDDFIFDSSGNLYLDANRSGGLIANEIERVKPDGTYTTLARDTDGPDEPSAVEFGTGAGEQGKLYITNIGMFSAAKHPSLEVLSVNA